MQFSKFMDPMLAKLDHWFAEGIIIVPNLVMAVVLMFVFRYLSGYGSRFITRVLTRVSNNEALVGLLSAVTKIAILTIGVFFALGILGLEKTVASLVAGAGVLALALGFAFQDLTTNFISGAFIAIQRPIKVGDVIETNGYTGKVKSINLRSVILDNFAGQQVELPSKDIFQKPIVNFTFSGERRVQVDCGIAYSSDLTVAEQVALAAVRSMDFLSKTREVEFNYTRFADNSIDFQLFFWIDQHKVGPGTAKSEVIKALKKRFEENNIVIQVGKKESPKEADPHGTTSGK
ncbi:mechanosensitive ion channel family protein [Dyadobacter helix]|nr:mechanosensitive ion channel family protein [Dyadobacter sp. CECT 9275]